MEAWAILLLVALATPVAGLTAAAVIRWRLRRSVARMVRTTPLCNIGDLRLGVSRVALQGIAKAVATLQAPIAGVPAIGYRINLTFSKPGSQDTGSQHCSFDASQIVEFDVEDETGTVRVRGEPAVLAGTPRVMDPGQVAIALTGGTLESLINQEGHSANDLVGARGLRATERLLLPDAPVFVCGQATVEVDPSGEAGYRQAPTRVMLEAPRGGTLVVADCHRGELLVQLKHRLG